MSVLNVGRLLATARPVLSIWSTQAKSPMHVDCEGIQNKVITPCHQRCHTGRSLTNVVHAVKPLAIDSRLLFIREFIQEKNPISVRNVGKPSARLDTLIYPEESTLERELTNVKNAEKSSDKVCTLLTIIKSMLQRRLQP